MGVGYEKLPNGKIRCKRCKSEQKSRSNFGRHKKTKKCQAAQAAKLRSLGVPVSTTSATKIQQQVPNAAVNAAPPRPDNQGGVNTAAGNQADITATLQKQFKNLVRELKENQRELQKLKNGMKRQKEEQGLFQQHQEKTDNKIKHLEQEQKKLHRKVKQIQQQINFKLDRIDQKLDYFLANPHVVHEPPTLIPQPQAQLKSSGSSVAGPNNATAFNAAPKKDASGTSCIKSANTRIKMNEDGKGLGQKRSSSEMNEGLNQPCPKRMREETNSDRMIDCITND